MPAASSSTHQHPRVWVALIALLIFLAFPLVWFFLSLLVINPVFPLGVDSSEVRKTGFYLQVNPQPTPSTIIELYRFPANTYSGQITCFELNMISPWVRLQQDGATLSQREVYIRTADQLVFPQESEHPFVCFPSNFPGKMAYYRLEMAESFNPLSYHVYEWSTKGD